MNSYAFNKKLLNILSNVGRILESSSLQINEEEVILISGKTRVATITPSEILLGKHSFQNEILVHDDQSIMLNKGDFSAFLLSISTRILRLNHIGVSYFCEDINTEIEKMKKVTKQSGLPLYEEASGDPTQRWLFSGDISSWKNALFEIVVSQERRLQNDYWRPHFQIDIDTSLTIEEIKDATDRYFGKNFIKWQLDIPNYGTVLAMGILGKVNGTKIALGIGTSLRRPEYHRKNLLKLL